MITALISCGEANSTPATGGVGGENFATNPEVTCIPVEQVGGSVRVRCGRRILHVAKGVRVVPCCSRAPPLRTEREVWSERWRACGPGGARVVVGSASVAGNTRRTADGS